MLTGLHSPMMVMYRLSNIMGSELKFHIKKKYPGDFVIRINKQTMFKDDLVNKLKEFEITEDFWVTFIGFEN